MHRWRAFCVTEHKNSNEEQTKESHPPLQNLHSDDLRLKKKMRHIFPWSRPRQPKSGGRELGEFLFEIGLNRAILGEFVAVRNPNFEMGPPNGPGRIEVSKFGCAVQKYTPLKQNQAVLHRHEAADTTLVH